MELTALRAALQGVSAYRGVKDHPVLVQTSRLLDALTAGRGEASLDAYTALFCALLGMIKNPAGIKGTIVSLALIIVVIGVAYFIARGHTIEIPNIEAGGYFGHSETLLTDTSILVTYVALIGAFLTAVGTEIYGAFK